jgi:hypothetical protein
MDVQRPRVSWQYTPGLYHCVLLAGQASIRSVLVFCSFVWFTLHWDRVLIEWGFFFSGGRWRIVFARGSNELGKWNWMEGKEGVIKWDDVVCRMI